MKPWCNLIFIEIITIIWDWWTGAHGTISLLRDIRKMLPRAKTRIVQICLINRFSPQFDWSLIVTGAFLSLRGPLCCHSADLSGWVTDHVWSAGPGHIGHIRELAWPGVSRLCPAEPGCSPGDSIDAGLTMEKHNTQLPVAHIKTWSKHKLSWQHLTTVNKIWDKSASKKFFVTGFLSPTCSRMRDLMLSNRFLCGLITTVKLSTQWDISFLGSSFFSIWSYMARSDSCCFLPNPESVTYQTSHHVPSCQPVSLSQGMKKFKYLSIDLSEACLLHEICL